MDKSDVQHVLVLEDENEVISVWIRPSYESARLTLRAWLAIKIVEFIEEQNEDDREETIDEISRDRPDFANASLWEINRWLINHDIACVVDIYAVTISVDPLREFVENRLRRYTSTE